MFRSLSAWPFYVVVTVALLSMPRAAAAHFLWVNSTGEGNQAKAVLYFAESAARSDYRLPDRVAQADFWLRTQEAEKQALETTKIERDGGVALEAPLPDAVDVAIEASCRYGIYMGSLLKYYAKHVGNLTDEAGPLHRSADFALDVVPEVVGKELRLTVLWQGKPLAGAEVAVEDAAGEATEAITDEAGRVAIEPAAAGLIGIRASHVDASDRGEVDGKIYKGASHYATVTLHWNTSEQTSKSTAAYPSLPVPIASFGGAVHDGWLYVYGGHTGEPHAHSRENISQHFRRIDLRGGHPWEELPAQTPLQSPALVAHGKYLYRVGGMIARNADGEDDDLHSVAEFSRFDPEARTWTAMPPLPQPRSSHDAVVMDGRLYVVGGWMLDGPGHGEWCPSAMVYDLSSADGQWTTLPEPSFRRRALAVAEWQGRLVAIGGMTDESEVSQAVDFFDPVAGAWTQGPDLPGSDMHGFGVAATDVNGSLYVSGASGIVYRLSESGDAWEEVAKLTTPRFFHRLVPLPTGDMLAVAGAAHGHGHLADLEQVHLPPSAASQPSAAGR